MIFFPNNERRNGNGFNYWIKMPTFAAAMNISTENKLSHYSALMRLGLPIVVGQLGNIVLGFADTLMIGHHDMKELAAAGFVNNMMMLIIVFAMGFSYGLTPVVGRMFGMGEKRETGRALRAGLAANSMMAVLMVSVAVLLYVFLPYMGQPEELLAHMRPYLIVNIVSLPFICWLNTFKQFYDAIGDTKMPMYVIIGGNALNIAGNYALIYGNFGMPELGLLGAGLSTLTSRIAMFAAFALIFANARRYREQRAGLLAGHADRTIFKQLNALGWPIALQMGMESAAFSLTAVFAGWIGTTSLAAHQIVITVSQLFFMIYYGLAAAVAVRVSHFSGQHDLSAVTRTAASGFHIILLVAVLVSIPIFLLRDTIGYWFTDDAEVCALVAATVIPLIAYQFGDGMQCNYANALRGMQHVKPMMLIAFVAYFVISLPLSWFAGIYLEFGIVGVWCGAPVSLMAAGIMYYTCFRKKILKEKALAE